MLTKAQLTNLKEIHKLLSKYFPYMRQDKVKRHIMDSTCIWDFGVAILYHVYKRPTKIGDTTEAKPGDVHLLYIANSSEGNGAAMKVAKEFYFDMFAKSNVWLKVREENIRATGFYDKLGLEFVDTLVYTDTNGKGRVYLKRKK